MQRLTHITQQAIVPALHLLPDKMHSQSALLMLLAIGLHESAFIHRQQINGPAKGFWQFERNGGVYGALNHRSTQRHALALCYQQQVFDSGVTWVDRTGVHLAYMQLAKDDLLAAGFARLLLWTDPQPLPTVGDQQGAWQLYLRTWRPGKPRANAWPASYQQALTAINLRNQ